MKKSIFGATLVLCIIFALPIIGNSFIKEAIDTRVVVLESYGLKVHTDKSSSSYFSTSRHFEFLLQDTQKFLVYLQQYSDKQIPPYVDVMLDGILVGADIQYSNLPFAKAFEIEIYPMKLSPKMSEELKLNSINFYKYTENFLQEKGILCHIKYNLLNDDFKGYIKDIKAQDRLKNSKKFMLTLEKANFKGNGELLAPKELTTQVKKFHFELSEGEESLSIVLHKFKSTNKFDSKNSYITSIDIEKTLLLLSGTQNDISLSLEKLRANASSNEQGESIQLNSKTSIKSLEFNSKLEKVKLKRFNFDIALSGVDRQEYANFTELLSQNTAQMSAQANAALQATLMQLLSKGIALEITDFSVKKFSKNSQAFIKGFDIKSKLTLQKDKNLVQKMQHSPLMAIPNISLESEIRISKELYKKLQNSNLILEHLDGYVKKDGDDYMFLLKFIDTKASVNGRSLN